MLHHSANRTKSLRKIAEEIKPRVVDTACGDGRLSVCLQALGWGTWACDANRGAEEVFKQLTGGAAKAFRYRAGGKVEKYVIFEEMKLDIASRYQSIEFHLMDTTKIEADSKGQETVRLQ